MGSYTIGVDLGQSDFTALAVVERVHVPPGSLSVEAWVRMQDRTGISRPVEEFHVRHLQRWPAGTSYPAIVDEVAQVMRRPPLDTDGLLVFDKTGVGVAVADLFREAFRDKRLRGVTWPVGITVTGGEQGQGWNLPKSDLVSALQVPMQHGRLRIAPGPLVEVLERELLAFRQKISTAGRTTYDVPRKDGEGHGDLATAVMLACAVPNTLRRPDLIDASPVLST